MKKMRLFCAVAAFAVLAALAPASAGEDTVVFGVVAPLTGNNIMIGDFIKKGALLAQKEINEKGGILGKKLEIVFEDEVDNLQTSVNGMTKLLNYPGMMGIYGSIYSSYCIAMSPMIREKKIPFLAGGSSANIPKEKNPYMWQARMTDDNSGVLLAKAAVEYLGMKNPAFMYCADSFGTGLKDQTVAALAKLGVTANPDYFFASNADEKQFTPFITQIKNSDADGLIGITHHVPAAIMCMQIDAAGLDIPLLGSNSFVSVIVLETAGEASEGWYGVVDWTPEVTTPNGKAFVDAYRKEYPGSPDPDMPAVVCYDSIKLFAEACRLANNTTDPTKINEGLGKIKAFPGAMSTFTPNDDHCFCTSQFLAISEDGLPKLKEIVYVREP